MRYFIEIAYKGTHYKGWQIQPNAISVQEVIEKAFSTILKTKITVVGAGRTDSGVHAQQMFAHFNYDLILPQNFVYGLNRFLPKDISVINIHKVNEKAHARFDATARTYTYFAIKDKNPFCIDTKWKLAEHIQLDVEKMNQAAAFFLENKDFSSFSKLHSDNKTNLCQVSLAEWVVKENEFIFTITANRFLRNMVRAIVGTLVEVGKNELTLTEFKDTICKKERTFASKTAPSEGLFLTHIVYPKEIFIHDF